MHTTRHTDDYEHLSIQLPQSVIQRLEETARQDGVRLHDMIRTIVERGLDSHNGQEIRRAA